MQCLAYSSTQYMVREFGGSQDSRVLSQAGMWLSGNLREEIVESHIPGRAQSPLLGLGQGSVPTMAVSPGRGHGLHDMHHQHNLWLHWVQDLSRNKLNGRRQDPSLHCQTAGVCIGAWR